MAVSNTKPTTPEISKTSKALRSTRLALKGRLGVSVRLITACSGSGKVGVMLEQMKHEAETSLG